MTQNNSVNEKAVHEFIYELVKESRRRYVRMVLSAIFLISIFALIYFTDAQYDPPSTGKYFVLSLFGVICLLFGYALLMGIIGLIRIGNIYNSNLYKLLTETPEKIISAKAIVIPSRSGLPITRITLMDADNKKNVLAGSSENIEFILDYLKQHNPNIEL